MKDKFRTNEDGKAASFELPGTGNRRLVKWARLLPGAVLLALALLLLVFTLSRGTTLVGRLEKLEKGRKDLENFEKDHKDLVAMRGEMEKLRLDLQSLQSKVQAMSSGPTKNSSIDARQIQKILKDLGYDPGPIDGKPGDGTKKAIRNFQHKENLTENGEIGDPEMIARLRARADERAKASGQ